MMHLALILVQFDCAKVTYFRTFIYLQSAKETQKTEITYKHKHKATFSTDFLPFLL